MEKLHFRCIKVPGNDKVSYFSTEENKITKKHIVEALKEIGATYGQPINISYFGYMSHHDWDPNRIIGKAQIDHFFKVGRRII